VVAFGREDKEYEGQEIHAHIKQSSILMQGLTKNLEFMFINEK
jgi:hypothetical protein